MIHEIKRRRRKRLKRMDSNAIVRRGDEFGVVSIGFYEKIGVGRATCVMVHHYCAEREERG